MHAQQLLHRAGRDRLVPRAAEQLPGAARQPQHAWYDRAFLLQCETRHERFLARFPTLNAFSAQRILHDAALRKFLAMPLERKRAKYPTVPAAMLDWTEDAFKARFGDAPRRTEVTVRLRHESKPDELFVRFSEHIDAESYAGYVRDMRRSGFARAWLVGKHVLEDSELHAQLAEPTCSSLFYENPVAPEIGAVRAAIRELTF